MKKDVPLKKGDTTKIKALARGKTPRLSKAALEKGDFQSAGPLSLTEKVKKVVDEGEDLTAEELALRLRGQMSKKDKSIAWGQYNTYLKHNPEEKKKYEAMSSLEKGNVQALWFLRKSSPKFCSFKMHISGTDQIKRDDTWKSQREMVDRFGEDEFKAHVESGRLLWREDPFTRGVYQYRDQGALSREITLQKGKTLGKDQEWEPDDDQDKQFASLFDNDLLQMLGSTNFIFSSDSDALTLAKGVGKGSSLGKGAGSVKGFQSRSKHPKEVQGPRTEEEQLEDAFLKCKKMRDVANKVLSDFQVLVGEVKGSKFWSKAAQMDAVAFMEKLKAASVEIQKVLLKKSGDYEKLKETCLKTAMLVKEAHNQMKEYKGLLHKTASIASKK